MTISSLWALQKAVHNKLTTNAALNAVIEQRIYDAVPADAIFPYIVIGNDTMRSWDNKSFKGSNLTLTLHVWSQEHGRGIVKQIMGLIGDALLEIPIALDDHNLVTLAVEFSQTFMEKDNQTAHGIIRIRALTHLAY
jgi:uncharacterized protein DUF3168